MPINVQGQFIYDDSQDNTFYRPQIQLDCRMAQGLVQEGAFSQSPLTIADVGVRLGFDRSWDIFSDQCLQVGFEPDREECDRLRTEYSTKASQHLPKVRLESLALWEYAGTQTLYVPRHVSAASCLPPNQAFFQRLPDPSPMEVVTTIEIETTTLDAYCELSEINFDVVKLDVQGGELAILKGAVNSLHSSILAVIAEVEFVALYENQPLFAEVDQFMRSQGFAIFDLDIRRWRRKVLPEIFDGMRVGQIIYGDAIYLKDPIEHPFPDNIDSDAKKIKLLKLAALAEYFSLPDYAIEILMLAADVKLIENSDVDRLVELLKKNQILAKRDRSLLNIQKS